MFAYKKPSFLQLLALSAILLPLSAGAERYAMAKDYAAKEFAMPITNAAKTFVLLEPPKEAYQVSSVEIVGADPRDQVPDKVSKNFQQRLDKALYENGRYSPGPFVRGNELKMVYTIVQYTKGVWYKRWWFGGEFWHGTHTPGRGSLGVQVQYLTPQGKELSRIQVEAIIGDQLYPERYQEAINWTVQDIVDYTSKTFGTTEHPGWAQP